MMTTTVLPFVARYRCLLFLLALLPQVHAQTAPAPSMTAKRVPTPSELTKYDKNANGVLEADEQAAFEAGEKSDAVMLTPFEVNTSQDRGYAAGNTIAGGRINTPLDLSPSSIQVINKEFMDDFAITDFADAAKWTMNVDVPAGNDAPFGGSRFEYNVRGAGGSGNYPMRDGIPQYFVADSYNSERFEVVSGPNSGMAGLGNSGGMAGSNSKRVRFDNRAGSVSLRGDNFGGYRGTLDYNYATDRFGIRVNALHQDTRSHQEGTSKKQNAITIRAEFKLTNQTLVTAQFERSGEWNTQYRTTYGDQQSFWDRTTVNLDNSALPATPAGQPGTGLSRISGNNGLNDRLTYNFATKSLINYRGNQYQTSGINYQIPWEGNPHVPTQWPGGANMIRSFGKDFWLGPVDNFADRDNNSRHISISHNFTPNLTARLIYQSSDIDPVTYWGNFSQPGDVRVDVNRLLPDGVTTNPNYLRSYSEWGAGGSQYQENENRDYVGEVSYRFSVPRFFDFKQSFTGIYTHRDGTYTAWDRTWRRTNNPLVPNPLDGQNGLTYRTYYGDPQPRVQPILNEQALNALMPGTTWQNISSTGWHADSIRAGRNAAIYSSSSFFQERLVISGNYRRDKIDNADMNGINIGGAGIDPVTFERYMGNVNPSTGQAEIGYKAKFAGEVDSFGLGTVVSPFPQKWRWLSPIKFVVNYSENNREPTSGGPFYTGERPGAPFSKTTDFAVRFSIPGGKVYGEVRRYFTENVGNLGGMQNTGNIQTIWRNLGYTTGSDTYDFQANSYRDINDRDLTGTEIELVANPTSSWTLRMNYGHPRVQTVNDRPFLRRYLAEHIAEWQAGALLPDGATVPGTNRIILSQATIVSNIQTIENGLNGLTTGTIGNGPLHRGTIATSYRFRQGTFRGLGLSGGLSWRGSSKQGSRDARIKFQTTSPTVEQTRAAAYDYLYVPSRLENNVGINYERRFGKYRARFQLNITNVLNDDDPQWSGYGVINAGQLTNQNDGNALTVANSNPRMQVLNNFDVLEPRKFVLTTTFDF